MLARAVTALLALALCSPVAAQSAQGAAQRSASAPAERLLVVNQRSRTLQVVDPAARKAIATIPVGQNGHEVAASRDGRYAYVPIYGDSGVGRPGSDGRTIDVVDLQTLQHAGSIDLGQPLRPHSVQVGRNGLLYVTAELAEAIFIVDPKTSRVVGRVPVGAPEAHMLALSPDERRGYTANVGPGSVSVLDMANRKLLAVIPVSDMVQRLAVSPDGRWVVTHDQATPRLVVIDSRTMKVARTIPLPGNGYTSAFTADGRRLLVGVRGGRTGGTNRLMVLDPATGAVQANIEADGPPQFIHMSSPDRAYVSSSGSGKVMVMNLRTNQLEPSIELEPGVDGLAAVKAGRAGG